jgi:alpha-L-arabinofuranosidase
VKGDNGQTKIVVVQKDETNAAPVHLDINVGGHSRSASALRMTGTSLADEATAVQGATVDSKGHLKPGRAEQLRVRNGSLGVDVPAGSAVVITLDCF